MPLITVHYTSRLFELRKRLRRRTRNPDLRNRLRRTLQRQQKPTQAAAQHAKYQSDEASFSISDGVIHAGSIPPAKAKLVQAWIEIHRESLMADWELAVSGQTFATPIPTFPRKEEGENLPLGDKPWSA